MLTLYSRRSQPRKLGCRQLKVLFACKQCHCPQSQNCHLCTCWEHVLSGYGCLLTVGHSHCQRVQSHLSSSENVSSLSPFPIYLHPAFSYPLAPFSSFCCCSFSTLFCSLSSFCFCFISATSFSFLSFSLIILTYSFKVRSRTPVIQQEGHFLVVLSARGVRNMSARCWEDCLPEVLDEGLCSADSGRTVG